MIASLAACGRKLLVSSRIRRTAVNSSSTLLTLEIRDPSGYITRWPVQVLPSIVSVYQGWVAGVVVNNVPRDCPVAGDFFEAAVSEGGLLEGHYEFDDALDGEWLSFDWRLFPTKLLAEDGRPLSFRAQGAYWTDGLHAYAAGLDGAPKGLDMNFYAVDEPWLIPPTSPSFARPAASP